MAKKTRMGRNLNALLGGATRNRPAESESDTQPTVVAKDEVPTVTPVPQSADPELNTSPSNSPDKAEVAAARPAGPQFTDSTKPTEPASTSAATNDTNNADSQASASTATSDVTNSTATPLSGDAHPSDRLRMLGVDQITRGLYQPRRHFDQELLQELADSIKAQGLIQPILVRAYGGKFELIAGERRWRASQLAGISDIPAIVRDMDDQSVAAVSLIENIQRADLNPLEEAQALDRLCAEFSMTHQQVAEAVGRSRVAVTNLMRLLELHDDVKSMVDNGELDMGHARALLGAPRNEQSSIAKRIVQQGLTVRAVEKLVKDLREGKSSPSNEPTKTDPNIEALGQKLGKLLGASVNIKHQQSGSGKLEIAYTSVDELEGILSHIK